MWVCVVSSRERIERGEFARGGSDGATTQDRIIDTNGLDSVRRSDGLRRVAGCGAARGSRRLVGRAGAARNTFDNPRRLF